MNRIPLAVLTFTLPLLAQDPAPKTAAAPSGPLVVVKTSREDVAQGLAMSMDHMDDLPAPPADGHWVLTLGADKKLAVAAAEGAAPTLEVIAQPGPLLDAFAEESETGIAMVRGVLTVGMQGAGLEPRDAAAFVKEVLEFPRQVHKLTLRIEGDPDGFPAEPMDVTLDVDSVPGSAFAATVAKLSPCEQGAPVLSAPSEVVSVRVSMTPDGLQTLFAPFRSLSMNFVGGDEAQKKRAAAVYDAFLALYDGGFAASVGANVHVQLLMGLLDGDKAREMAASDDYRALMQNQQMPSRDMELEVQFDAVEHRGVKLTKSKITGAEPNAMMPDGVLESLFACVGSYYAVTMGGGEAAAKHLIDLVTDQKLKRAPLAGGALVKVTMDVAGMMAAFVPDAGDLPPDAPTKLDLTVSRRDKTLRLHLHFE